MTEEAPLLQRYIDQRFRDIETRIEIIANAQEQARKLAQDTLNARLEQMNELRDQINRERNTFVTTAFCQARSDTEVGHRRSIEAQVQRLTHSADWRTWLAGILGSIIGAVIAVITLVMGWK